MIAHLCVTVVLQTMDKYVFKYQGPLADLQPLPKH